ncbi:unnamed protein product [Lepidochelys kempii]
MVTVTCNDHPRLVLDENRCLVFGTLCEGRRPGSRSCRQTPHVLPEEATCRPCISTVEQAPRVPARRDSRRDWGAAPQAPRLR